MEYIYGTIEITEENSFLHKKIYKYSENINLAHPKIDRKTDGSEIYVYKVDADQEFEFNKLLLKVIYWKSVKRAKERSILNNVEEILNDNFSR